MLKYVVSGLLLCLQIGCAFGAPVFDFSGRVSDGELYALDLGDDGLITLTSPKCDVWTFACLVTVGNKRHTLGELSDTKLRIDETNNRAVFSGVCDTGSAKVAVDFELTLNRTDVLLTVSENSKGKGIKLELAALQNAAKLAEKDVRAGDGEVLGFATARSQIAGDLQPVTFCPEVPPRKLTLEPRLGASQDLLSAADIAGIGQASGLILTAKNGKASLQIRKNTQVEANHSPDTYGGVDFWKHDQLKMPNYNLSRNLLQNPGFEQGFKYWTYGPLGVTTDMSQGEFFAITEDAPYSGNRCLQIRGDRRQDPPRLATFAIPIEKGQFYTISFYAKAKAPVSLGIFVQYERWGGDLFHWKSAQITTDWQRHEVSFTSRFTCTSFALGLGRRDGLVWVDNVQFEKGKLTPFTQKPAGVCFVTGQRGNLVEPGTAKDSTFQLSGKPGAQLNLAYKVEDIFGKVRFSGKSAVSLNNKGTGSLPVNWVPKLPVGLYSIESDISLDGKHLFREFDRICVMASAAKTPTKYPVFFTDNLTSRNANWQRKLERSKYFGLDTVLNFKIPDYNTDKDGFKKAVKAAGLYHVGCLTSDGYDTSSVKEPTAKIKLDELEEHAYQIAKKHAGITAWKTINEPHTLANEDDMKVMVDYVAALSKGAKRFNPDNLVITPDPSNMYPKAGIKYIDLFLKYGGGKYCDIIGIHPYRGRPEEPDLDSDIAAMVDMLDRHHVKKDIWFTEGIYHNNYVLPPYKLNSHRGCSSDHFRTGDFSYHIGWGEKIGFAYTMRSWIITLKYADRVKMSVDWVFGRYSALDHELTPTVKAFAPNALKHLLCMADFKNDLGFGREVRGYMFEDEQKRPIAAIWTYNFLIDAGQEKGLKLNIASLPRDIELMDCFGATLERPKDNLITIGSFPVFVRGGADSIAKLNAAFKQTNIVSKNFQQTFMSVKATGLNAREFTLKNMQPYRSIAGNLKLMVDGKPVFNDTINVGGDQTWKKTFGIGARANKVQIAEIQAEFTDSQGGKPEVFSTSSESMAAIKATKPINIDGDLADWPQGAMVSLEPRFKYFMPYLSDQKKARKLKEKYPKGITWKGEKDLSAKLHLAWDSDNLYIAFDVTDNTLETADKIASAWMGDSIQMYFDCWADAAGKYTRGFDINDQVFDVWPHDNQAVLRRAFAPEQQLGFLKTGVVEKAKTAFRKTPDGYIVEMAIPAHDVFPVKLFKGSLFGFAAIVNDRDVGFRHQGLVTTPNGSEPYPNPHLYPTVILK
jgi:hypothetical protein